MTSLEVLQVLKADLEIINGLQDSYLKQLITVAESEIKREGITISTGDYSPEDTFLIVMYAAYLYRKRSPGSNGQEYISNGVLHPQGMPYMLRLALNNRLFSQKMRTMP